jgi:hypothetical protein
MFYAGSRPLGRLFYWAKLFGAVCVLLLSPFMMAQSSPPTTTVADTVYRADGTAASGSVVILWPPFTTAAGAQIAGGFTTTTLGSGGALSVNLVSNVGASPAGSFFTAVYQLGPPVVKGPNFAHYEVKVTR